MTIGTRDEGVCVEGGVGGGGGGLDMYIPIANLFLFCFKNMHGLQLSDKCYNDYILSYLFVY